MRRQVFFTILILTAATAVGDLVGYWDFEEGSGSIAADSSGNSYDAEFFASDGSNYSDWTGGRIGTGAVLLNDSTTSEFNSNHLVVDANSFLSSDPNLIDPNIPGLGNMTEVFTLSMWVRRDAVDQVNWPFPRLVHTDAYDVQLSRYPEGSSGSNDPYDFLGWSGADNDRINIGLTTTAQAVGNWYHLAVTCNGQMITRYINGVQEESVGIPAVDMPLVTTDLIIGSQADNASYFIGALDDVAIWAGSYLPAEEVAKLADETASPLTVEDVVPDPPLPPNYFVKETNMAWTENGWKLLYGPGFSTFTNWPVDNITVHADNTATVWYIKDTETAGWPSATMTPGGHYALWSEGQRHWYYFRDITPENYYGASARNVENYGMAWVDPSWSGVDPNVAKFAVYITPDIALCMQDNAGYQGFVSLDHGWLNKDYFKTYARVAAVNGEGASLRVKSYSYADGTEPLEPNSLTLLGDVLWPLTEEDYVWQGMKYAYPKPTAGSPRVWTEISIVGGHPDTRVYIDEFSPVSDQANTSQHFASYYSADINRDAIVNSEDLLLFSIDWLDVGLVSEPRDTGMLANGDFYQDISLFGTNEWIGVTPSSWVFTGVGDAGIQRMDDRGLMNSYMLNTPAPMGGSVAAYLIDDAVLSQTTVVNAVEGQTYYAMAYVMTSSWDGWKDIATLSLEIDGLEVASFARPMSLERWRPVYGTYTATAADAGKPITVKLSYDDVSDPAAPGYMFVGYAYLDTVMPAEWPEGRDNLLSNGGFEDIDWMIGTALEPLYNSISTSDNWGDWFVDDVPAPPSWIYEVPSGFNEANEGGMFASGQMGAPIPSPGMNDVSIYASEDLILGQIVGSLANGVTYYLDMACGVVIEPTEWGSYAAAWPAPVPQFHLELWQIPAGVTDADAIHTGITTSQPGYVKIAEAVEDAVGDIKGGGQVPPASRWQMMGTSYTATSADTNVYVRVYGTNSVTAPHPSFAFSDVYISTEKRRIPGGDITFEIGAGLQYDVSGPYSCSHAGLMGLDSPEGDVDGDCRVNLSDLAVMAGNWIQNWYTNISGTTPWE